MARFVAAGAGFLLAVLWFDLMFDVQVLRRGDDEGALASIAAYYARVTTAARPMNRLVALAMVGTIASAIVQVARGEHPRWVGIASRALILSAVALAAAHTVPSAVRLGIRRDTPEAQHRLARSILRDHLVCFAAVGAALVMQLAG